MLLCLASELIFQTVSRLASSRRFPPQKFAHSYFRVCIFTLHYFRIPDFCAPPSFLEPMSCPLTGRDLTHKNTRNLASVTCRVFRFRVIFIAVRANASCLPLSTFPAICNQLECQSAPQVKIRICQEKIRRKKISG